MEGQFEELQQALTKAHSEVLTFLEEKERAAVNNANGIKIHLENKRVAMEECKTRLEKMATHTNDILFLKVPQMYYGAWPISILGLINYSLNPAFTTTHFFVWVAAVGFCKHWWDLFLHMLVFS